MGLEGKWRRILEYKKEFFRTVSFMALVDGYMPVETTILVSSKLGEDMARDLSFMKLATSERASGTTMMSKKTSSLSLKETSRLMRTIIEANIRLIQLPLILIKVLTSKQSVKLKICNPSSDERII